MKKTIMNLAIASLAVVMATSCQKDNLGIGNGNEQYASVIDVAYDGSTVVLENNLRLALVTTSVADSADLQALITIKNDEKLARDVYSALNAKSSNNVFANISRSESRHLGAINILLAMYSPADIANTAAGVFTNPDVQKLYDNIIAVGNASLADALKVGATIEDLDIRDITLLSSKTSNANISLVFENLLKGSRNHLRAFSRQLSNLGITYTPQYIDQAAYDQIISSPFEKGKQYRMNGNGMGNGNGVGKKGNGNDNGGCKI